MSRGLARATDGSRGKGNSFCPIERTDESSRFPQKVFAFLNRVSTRGGQRLFAETFFRLPEKRAGDSSCSRIAVCRQSRELFNYLLATIRASLLYAICLACQIATRGVQGICKVAWQSRAPACHCEERSLRRSNPLLRYGDCFAPLAM